MNLHQGTKLRFHRSGLTLIEMTVVILVLLTLTGAFFASSGSIGDWQKAKDATAILRDVDVAQREFLANNPQRAVDSLTVEEVAEYLPNSPATLPTAIDLEGNNLDINITVAPPVLVSGGSTYDPSGSATDSLWDVGK